MTMKENQNAASFDSESFGSKETHELNYSRMDASLIVFEEKDRNESSNCKVMDDFSIDQENGTMDSPTKEGHNGHSHHLSGWDKDADSLSSDSSDIDKEQRSQDHESSTIVTELFETEMCLFTDKNVLECEDPELKVSYKEIDCQILKDICIDEGRPENDVNLIKICKDAKPGLLYLEPPNDNEHFEDAEDPSLEYANCLGADKCGSKEENDGKKLVSEGRLESSMDNFYEKVSAEHCNPENSVQIGEANCGATVNAETDSSEVNSFMSRKLPTENFSEGYSITQSPDQILEGKAVSESPDASAEVGGKEGEFKASSLVYNSKVESRIITFNFDSPVPSGVGNGITENVKEHSAESAGVAEDVNAENLSDAGEVCSSNIIENAQEQSLNIEDGDSDGGSATSSVRCVRSEDSSSENAHEQSPESKDVTNSGDSSTDGPGSSRNNVQAVEPNIPQHERSNSSGNASLVNQLQHDGGETSFSAASLIGYSGPIAFSGSLSHRSDGSTTSGKSFAFPILQSEWNSSPVRMAKADRRHFRKHKSWRSGLLCCRF